MWCKYVLCCCSLVVLTKPSCPDTSNLNIEHMAVLSVVIDIFEFRTIYTLLFIFWKFFPFISSLFHVCTDCLLFLALCCRSPDCLLETARPQGCCWLQAWGGDRRPSTSSHRGIPMSLLLSNIETVSPQVMNHTHSIYIHGRVHSHFLWFYLMQFNRFYIIGMPAGSRCMHPHGLHTYVLHPRRFWPATLASNANEASWLSCPT